MLDRSVGAGGRVRRFATILVAIPLALLATGCSSGKGNTDALQVVANPVAATAPVSPAPGAKPAGPVYPAGNVTAMATDQASGVLAAPAGQASPPLPLDRLAPAPA